MLVKISVPGAMEAEVVEVKDGVITLRPMFYGKGFEGIAAVIKTFKEDSSEPLIVSILKVDGRKGGLSLSDRTKPGKPAFERPKKEKQVRVLNAKPGTK